MKFQPILAAFALAGTVGLSSAAPASADSAATTRNLILGAAAVVAGIAIESNVSRKHAAANTVVGYMPNGATVYDDGHVVEPSGQSWYPGDQGKQLSCNGQNCTITGQSAYARHGTNYLGYQSNGSSRSAYRRR